jgi:hypothetical protein
MEQTHSNVGWLDVLARNCLDQIYLDLDKLIPIDEACKLQQQLENIRRQVRKGKNKLITNE